MTRLHEILGYEVISVLGHGARSTIFAVKDRGNHVYALKHVIKRSPSDQRFLDQAVTEHQVARRFDHPHLRKSFKLIRQRKVIRTSEILVLMEMVDGSTLEQHQPENVVELCRICRQAAEALHSMHQGAFVHADIKPNNILVDDRLHVTLIDFGQSCPTGTIKQRIQGTPDYIAPEQVRRKHITPRTDVFNLGATMYWLLTGKHVPTLMPKGKPGVDLKVEYECHPPGDVNPEVSPALSSLVMQCIETDPMRRPETMEMVRDRLDLAIAQTERAQNGGSKPDARRRRRSKSHRSSSSRHTREAI